MSRIQQLLVILTVNFSHSLGFFCYENSSEVNKNLDFNEISKLKWQLSANLDKGKYLDFPVSFEISEILDTVITSSKTSFSDQSSEKLIIEFNSSGFYAVLVITRFRDTETNSTSMEYRYCSNQDFLSWRQVFLYFNRSKQILTIYICNESRELLMVLTVEKKMTSEMKNQIQIETSRVSEIHHSNLIKVSKVNFIGVNESNFYRYSNACEKEQISTFIHAKPEPKLSEILLKGLIVVAVWCFLVVSVLVSFTIVKEKTKTNQIYPIYN
jgi:hypothetical protein